MSVIQMPQKGEVPRWTVYLMALAIIALSTTLRVLYTEAKKTENELIQENYRLNQEYRAKMEENFREVLALQKELYDNEQKKQSKKQ